jgi:hypothetical protein
MRTMKRTKRRGKPSWQRAYDITIKKKATWNTPEFFTEIDNAPFEYW